MIRYTMSLPPGLERPPEISAVLLGRDHETFVIDLEERYTVNELAAFHALFTRWLVEALAASENPSSAMVFLSEVGDMVYRHKIELGKRKP